jgi:flagellar biosynthetic protein FliR
MALDMVWAATAALLWVRLSALFFLTPIFSTARVAPGVSAIFLLALAGVLASTEGLLPYRPSGVGSFVLAVLAETLTGAVMGFALQCVFAAVSMAGQILDLQLGLSMGAMFDPVTRSRSPVLGSLFSMFAVAVFFGLDGHLALLQGFAFAARELPPGAWWFLASPGPLVALFGSVFVLAVTLIAPALAFMLLLEVVLAVVSRALPQFNIFFVGLPVKIMAGLAVLALTANTLPLSMAGGFARAWAFWGGLAR